MSKIFVDVGISLDGLISGLNPSPVNHKDIRISGGANIIQQFLNAGLVDELALHIAPFILGKGIRVFENLDITKFKLDILEYTKPVFSKEKNQNAI